MIAAMRQYEDVTQRTKARQTTEQAMKKQTKKPKLRTRLKRNLPGMMPEWQVVDETGRVVKGDLISQYAADQVVKYPRMYLGSNWEAK